jgi:hypothetical protein
MRKSATAKRFVAPKATKNDAKYEPQFQYQCTKCRCTVSPKKALTNFACPIFRKGHPCEGKLVRFGVGTGRGSHFKKAVEA